MATTIRRGHIRRTRRKTTSVRTHKMQLGIVTPFKNVTVSKRVNGKTLYYRGVYADKKTADLVLKRYKDMDMPATMIKVRNSRGLFYSVYANSPYGNYGE